MFGGGAHSMGASTEHAGWRTAAMFGGGTHAVARRRGSLPWMHTSNTRRRATGDLSDHHTLFDPNNVISYFVL